MIFNIHPTNQKSLTAENLQLRLLFQSKSPYQPQEETLLRQQLHTHSFTEIFGCIEGQIRILDFNGREHSLQAGDLAIVPSGVEHMMLPQVAPQTQWADLGLLFQKLSLPDAADLFGKIKSLLSGEEIAIYRNRPALCRLLHNCQRFGNRAELSTLLSFLAELIKLPAPNQREESKKSWENAKDIDRLLKLDDIINMNFSQNFSNQEIAALLFISKRQLSRIVEKHYGEPLRQLILKKRLQGAAELLRSSDEKVESIARKMGFSNKNSFFREFKKYYHQTPLAWRKKALDSFQ